MGNFANSEDPDEMQHNVAFHIGQVKRKNLRHQNYCVTEQDTLSPLLSSD